MKLRKIILIVFVCTALIAIIGYLAQSVIKDKKGNEEFEKNPIYLNQEKKEEVSNLIKMIEGIENAKVTIGNPEGHNYKVASILLTTKEKPSEEKIRKIIDIMTKKVDALEEKNITIINNNMDIIYPEN